MLPRKLAPGEDQVDHSITDTLSDTLSLAMPETVYAKALY
jgi:hypothetical protein